MKKQEQANIKAVVYTEYGGADALRLEEVEKPKPRSHEVLVKIHAVSINDWDWGMLQGLPYFLRPVYGLRKPRLQILGSDIAGRIEAVGRNVERWQIGDAVYGDLSGNRFGGFAEYVCAAEVALAPKPDAMSFEQAAAIPQAAMLAIQAFGNRARLQPGQRLLVNGAGGGVGTCAIQVARIHGLETTAVDSAGKLQMLRSIGYDQVMDYRLEDFTRTGQRYDLIIDAKSTRTPWACARALNPGGTYATVGGSTHYLLQMAILGPLISKTSQKRIRVVGLKQNSELAYVNGLFDAGQFEPVIDGSYELSQLPEAMAYFGRAEHQGKVVITISKGSTV